MSSINLLNVFQYWGQGYNSMPLFIKIIYKHNLEFCKKNNINLILIDDNNVNNYITPHVRFKTLAYNFKSDIIRYYILHKYGGFWFDTDVIIIKDLNDLYESIKTYECMLDTEYDKRIGCCSLFIKKESSVSNFCVNYINDVLDKKTELVWGDIGPKTAEALYNSHSSSILLNNYETVKNGCNFICYDVEPGKNKKDWYLESKKVAKSKADFLKNNDKCYYLITWTIYRINDMGENLNDLVFNDERSVFSYFINYEKKKILVKNSHDVEWNGEYYTGDVKWKDSSSISYVKDSKHHIYSYNGIFRLGESGVTVYKILKNNIENEIDLNNIENEINLNTFNYAVMWASTVNIGDDIQTLAAINFLKKKGITEYTFIDREKLSDYDGVPVKLVMNGWYMHNINKFPPSDKITPIFISVHINNEVLISNNVNYFKKYEPIGCRDEATVILFKKYGIDSYFTGCLTLLFDEVKEKIGGKYLVDVNTKCNYIPNIEINTSKFKDYQIIEHDININIKYNKPLYITFIFDKNYIDIFITVIKSIILNEYKNNKNKIIFLINFFGNDEDINLLKNKVKIFSENKFYFKNIPTEYPELYKKINDCYDFKSAALQIKTSLVYCRFYLDTIWKNINDIVLYLDLDIIVKQPISEMFNSFDTEHVLFACPNSDIKESIESNFTEQFNNIQNSLKNNYKIINNIEYDLKEPGFNGGVWAVNLKKFREEVYSKKLEICMLIQSKKKIFNHNDQGIMNVIFYKKFKHINNDWNVLDYGNEYNLAERNNIYQKLDDKFEAAKIIHYNGPDKPWKKIKHYYPKCVDLWNFYKNFNGNSNYYSYLTSLSIKKRLNIAENLLNKYRAAELVITTRLHCILPCRAFNTKSIFIHKKYTDDPRFKGLKEIINGDIKEHYNSYGNTSEMEKIRNNFKLLKI